MNSSPSQQDFEFSPADYQRACSLIYTHAGIALGNAKQQLVYSRLVRRLRLLGLIRFSDYLDRLERDNGEEWQHFTNALTTNLTSFFRESHHFPLLAKHLVSLKRNRPLRVWCCAASTGEEPWSIAMTACEAFNSLTPPVQILATDIDTDVLLVARDGVYDDSRVNELTQPQLHRFFQRGIGVNAGRVRVRPELQSLVTFKPLNLVQDDWLTMRPFDAIFCRNVMIYFDKPTQYNVLKKLTRCLEPDGLLFAGHSESFFHAGDLVRLRAQTVYESVASVRPRGEQDAS